MSTSLAARKALTASPWRSCAFTASEMVSLQVDHHRCYTSPSLQASSQVHHCSFFFAVLKRKTSEADLPPKKNTDPKVFWSTDPSPWASCSWLVRHPRPKGKKCPSELLQHRHETKYDEIYNMFNFQAWIASAGALMCRHTSSHLIRFGELQTLPALKLQQICPH